MPDKKPLYLYPFKERGEPELEDSEGELSIDHFRQSRFGTLLKLGFPQEYLWTVKCRSAEEFKGRWTDRAILARLADKEYVIYINCGKRLIKTIGFNTRAEFKQACAELTEHSRKCLPIRMEDEIEDLEGNLPRRTSGGI